MTEVGSDTLARRRLPFADVAKALDPSRLHLIVMPTEKCNFRCTYCYENFAQGRMSADTRAGLVRFIERRSSDLKTLLISWFGGEPLMAVDIIDEVSRAAMASSTLSAGLAYRANMTTNGYLLTAPMIRRLVAMGISEYQVTLDGPGPTHDETRKLAGGGATFERIWSNLLALRACSEDFSIVLRLHVHPLNYPALRVLAAMIRDELLTDPRFDVIVRPVKALGGPNDDNFARFEARESDAIAVQLAEQLGVIGRFQQLSNYICYAAKANSLVIRADGTLAKCTVALHDRRNAVGRLNTDGSLTIDQDRLSLWMEGVLTADSAALACPNSKIGKKIPGKDE